MHVRAVLQDNFALCHTISRASSAYVCLLKALFLLPFAFCALFELSVPLWLFSLCTSSIYVYIDLSIYSDKTLFPPSSPPALFDNMFFQDSFYELFYQNTRMQENFSLIVK